jgi:MATE family multidrug resistance protein
MAATTVMEFTDRIFLANYNINAIAAAMPAGIAVFLILTLFIGVTSYLNVFIAQYSGAGMHDRIGTCLWQGIYFSAFAAVALVVISFFSPSIFKLSGHPPEIQYMENQYFTILCLGGGINVLGTGLACFFSGRGRTRPVMVISFIGMVFNIPLDYAMINGKWIFPEMGIQGAGIATVCSWALITVLFILLIFNQPNDKKYGVRSQWRFDGAMFRQIIRKGGPAGLQFTLDVLAFTFFIFLVGRIGKLELAVTNIVLSIQSISFMPAIGFSIGLSTLVGHSLGRNNIKEAVSYTNQTIFILLVYTFSLACVFVFFPKVILGIFLMAENNMSTFTLISDLGSDVMKFMAAFICFDAMYFSFLGVLRGAGDTRFVMWAVGTATVFVMILPLTGIVFYFQWGLYACWINLTVYVLTLFSITFIRYKRGDWKKIRVIQA